MAQEVTAPRPGLRRAGDALFVLLPDARALDDLLADLPPGSAALCTRVYARADGRAHLLSLVRAGRDPVATHWVRGMVACIAGGAALGALTTGILAGALDLFGGLVALAVPFGFVVGAFLGGFSGLMNGTQVARPEVRLLAAAMGEHRVLASIAGDRRLLDELQRRCAAAGFACRLAGS